MLINEDGKWVGGTTSGVNSFNASLPMTKGSIPAGNYVFAVDSKFFFNTPNSRANEYRNVLVDIYSTKAYAMQEYDEADGWRLVKSALGDYIDNHADQSKWKSQSCFKQMQDIKGEDAGFGFICTRTPSMAVKLTPSLTGLEMCNV